MPWFRERGVCLRQGEARVRSQVSICGICGRQSSIETNFSSSSSLSLALCLSESFHQYFICKFLSPWLIAPSLKNVIISLSLSYTRISRVMFFFEEMPVAHQIKNLLQNVIVYYLGLIICMLNTRNTFITYLFDIHFNIITSGKIRKL